MKNELIIVQDIEKRLKQKREPPVFPLTPTHRKELRELRDRNVGDLRERLKTIKKLKEEEYKKRYSKEIQLELIGIRKKCKLLNDDWIKRIHMLNKIIKGRKNFEEKNKSDFLELSHDWSTISELKEIKDEDRKYGCDETRIINKIASTEFDEKYSKPFEEVEKKIDDIYTKYEEAINFGDLEIVKLLYYTMKSADKLFEKISDLKV